MGSLLCPRLSNEARGQPQGSMFSPLLLAPPPPPDELEDQKSPKGQEKHPSHG